MRRLFSAIETVAALFLLLIALLTAGNVLLRYAFSMQIPDWFDGTQMLQGIAMFWGIALATYYGTHIGVDIVWEHLGRPGRRRVDLFATVVTAAFLAPLAWMVWVKVGGTGSQGTMDLRLPLKWFYSAGAVGASVASLLALVRLWQLWQGREASPEPLEEDVPGAAHGS
ncbi:TRAP transporter small permease [Hydrogenophaga sp.]|uniref:TRAP transporter small permease n=1 Tax=Hydrogenophaga sp. TaxID=1904254 RepID=UPI0026294E28|nr:TRAP transporter small permease [Hydrogenophaga sp.]MCW5654448.1 TRAP transporter small permease [Hydrogenophaga sp.]